MGFFACPTIEKLGVDLVTYIYLFNKFIEQYEDDKENFYTDLLASDENVQEFASMLYFFFDTSSVKLQNNRLVMQGEDFHILDVGNISLFMESLRVLHGFERKDDNYLPANKVAAEMIAEAKRRKKETMAKIKKKDGVGFLEIMSTVCARHSSVNPTNIGQLNYYQVIDQYERLLKIDEYTPCLYGNATEEYVKKNKIKHYSVKIIKEE
jgi:hypothetical protein